MKLTKDQRWIAYCILLQEYEQVRLSGFCLACKEIFGWNDNDQEGSNGFYKWAYLNLKYLPELNKKKPRSASKYSWFPRHTSMEAVPQRILLLKQCISETEPK